MKATLIRIALIGAVVAAAAFGYLELPLGTDDAAGVPSPPPTRAVDPAPNTTIPSPAPATRPGASSTAGVLLPGVRHVVDDVRIKNYGDVIYRGSVDLSATIERIRAGVKHPHRNDGSVFGNREGLLPRKARGYYREYVHPTDGIRGPGPQRLVVGKGGDWWYTPDHYASFVELGTERRR